MDIDTPQSEQRPRAQDRLAKAGLVLLAILVLIAIGVAGAFLLHELHKGPPGSFLGLKEQGGSVLKTFVGAQVQDLSDDVARQLGLQQPGGVLVSGVIVGSPADTAGMQEGDIILEYGQAAVQRVDHLLQMLSESSPGDEVRFLVDRGGRRRQLYVRLASSPAPADDATLVAGGPQSSTAEDAAPAWGMAIAPLSPLRAQEQNVPANVTGVIVVSVDPAGAAAAAGLQPGDVIAAINRRSIDDLASFYAAIAQSEEVLLELYRSGRLLYVSVEADPARPPTVGVGALLTGAPAAGKIIIATDGASLDSSLAMRFATAPYFLIVDLSTNSATAVANPYATASRGIGIPAAQFAINQGAATVITGRIREALARYQRGELVPTTTASIQGYGYAQQPIEVTGSPSSSSDDSEEEGGYKGQPETIPPMGQATAASSNRPELCVCPICGTTVAHPLMVSCAALTCPVCGGPLVPSSSGLVTTAAPMTVSGPTTMNRGTSESTTPASSPTIAPMTIAAPTQMSRGEPQTYPPPTRPNAAAMTIAGPSTMGPTVQPTAASSPFPSVCICPACGTVVVHPAGVPCASLLCPVCGTRLVNAAVGPTLTAQQAPLPVAPTPQTLPQGGMGQSQRGAAAAPQAPPQGGMGQSQQPAPSGATWPSGAAAQSPGVQTSGPPSDVGPTSAGGAGTGRSQVCVCPVCGTTVAHPAGIPCSQLTCPECGSRLLPGDLGLTSAAWPPGAVAQSPGVQTGGPPGDVGPDTAGSAGANRTEVCVCPVCGTTVAHPAGIPCSQLTCPQCGSRLLRADPTLMSAVPPQASAPSSTSPATNGIWTSTSGMAVWLCPSCGTMIPRGQDDTSSTTSCPSCGTAMLPATAGISLVPSWTQPSGSSTIPVLLTGQTTPAAATANAPTVAIPTTGRTTSAEIAPLFDRAPFFLIIGLGTFRVIPNPNVNDARGVGIQSAQLVVSEGASAVIADNISLEAMNALRDLRVKVYAGVKGTADQALQWFGSDRLTETTVAARPTDDAHSSYRSKEKAKGENVAL